MGKGTTEGADLGDIERKLIEKKQLLASAINPLDGNGINTKKLTRDEKDKIRRALKKKKRKQKKRDGEAEDEEDENQEEQIRSIIPKPDIDENVEIEYREEDEYLLTGKYYDEFKDIFKRFTAQKPAEGRRAQDEEEEEEEENEDEAKAGEGEQQLSRKKKKMLKRLQVAQLKAQVKRPDVVEVLNIEKLFEAESDRSGILQQEILSLWCI